ncbi:transposase [Agrobacterium larrymoorei]|uniref:Transposase n=2 Tax=Agrobacterium larrymoorei TaxID=160699 RepID=A0AAJ2BA46_9HYPH|nr:transposase [Agrobacterium larrymoorei]
MSDYEGAAKMIGDFSKAKTPLADKGYDADCFRDALVKRKITAVIPHQAHPEFIKVSSRSMVWSPKRRSYSPGAPTCLVPGIDGAD